MREPALVIKHRLVEIHLTDVEGSSTPAIVLHHTEQTEAFQQALEALIERHCGEFDMTYVQIVGVLQMQVVFLSLESRDDEKDPE